MRSSYELAWMAAALYANQPVNFLSLDALSFHLPVSIGTVLSLSSHVTYTNNHDGMHDTHGGSPVIASVVVLAEINDVASGLRRRSNTFHYSFDLGSQIKKRVIPGEIRRLIRCGISHIFVSLLHSDSYSDSMAWIEGKRRVELGQDVRRNYRR